MASSTLASQLSTLDVIKENIATVQAQIKAGQTTDAITGQNLQTSLTNLQNSLDYQTGLIAANSGTVAQKTAAASNTATDQIPVQQTLSPGESVVAAQTQNTGTDASRVGKPTSAAENKNVTTQVFDDGSTLITDNATGKITSTPSTEDGNTAPATTTTTQVGGKTAMNVAPVDNVLGGYASYTYGLSLHVLSAKDYNDLAFGNPDSLKKTKTLIANASRFKSNRDAAFQDDFFFDAFKMQTIIGLNSNNRSTNAIQISFTLIEPYGMTLLDRILDVATNEIGVPNYLSLPYLLEINFFGIDDAGKAGILNDQTKYIPIRFVDFKIKASVKGAEYNVTAVPFNHQAYMASTQGTPANFEITATTIADFFKNTTDTGTTASVNSVYSQINNPDKQRATPKVNVPAENTSSPTAVTGEVDQSNLQSSSVRQPTATKGDGNTANNINSAPVTPSVQTTSYTAAYNAWYKLIETKGSIEAADQISFEFDPEIQSASIVNRDKNPIDKTGPKAAGGNSNATNKGNDPTTQSTTAASGPNFNQQVFSVNAGTDIIAVLNQIITNSSYIRNQIADTESDAVTSKAVATADNLSSYKGNAPVKWFKIIPKVKLGVFDKKRNAWQKLITYYVKTFQYYNGKDPRAPKSQPPGAVKRYDYIYTGKNKDIIDFSMDFNALYFTAVTVTRNKTDATMKTPGPNDEEQLNDKGETQQAGSITPGQISVKVGDAPSTAMNTSTSGANQNAASVRDNIYSGARGDMLNVKLRILGDPDFIKQDDLFYPPDFAKDSSQYIKGSSGSLNMNSGEIFCYLTFNTPVDIDETTGLLRKDSKYYQSKFSGYYRVMTVESELRQGKFTQTLDLIRQQNQPGDGIAANTSQRTIDNTVSSKASNKSIAGSQVTTATTAQIPPYKNPITAKTIDDAVLFNKSPAINPDTILDSNLFVNNKAAVDANDAALQKIAAKGKTVPITSDNSNSDGSPIII